METRTTKPFAAISLPLFDEGAEAHNTVEDSVFASIEALRAIGNAYDYWVIPYSGGKDSTALVTLICWAIESKLVECPKMLIVLQADTGQELVELQENSVNLFKELKRRGYSPRVVYPKPENRFYVSVLGKGLLPVHPSMQGRWCTRVLKVEPMAHEIESVYAETQSKFLLMSGVRFSESDRRDQKLENSKQIAAAACSKDSGECGAGGIWLDKSMSDLYTGLPLLVHWRDCHVYDWLQNWVDIPSIYPDLPLAHGYREWTWPVAKMYGQGDDGLLENPIRFGCIGCPAVNRDKMTEKAIVKDKVLLPLLELHAVWDEMRKPRYRLWKPSKNNKFSRGHFGPLKMECREYFLNRVLDIANRSGVDLITEDDQVLIRMQWALNIHPRGWDGSEVPGELVAEIAYGQTILNIESEPTNERH